MYLFKFTKKYGVIICLYVDDMLIIGTNMLGILETCQCIYCMYHIPAHMPAHVTHTLAHANTCWHTPGTCHSPINRRPCIDCKFIQLYRRILLSLLSSLLYHGIRALLLLVTFHLPQPARATPSPSLSHHRDRITIFHHCCRHSEIALFHLLYNSKAREQTIPY